MNFIAPLSYYTRLQSIVAASETIITDIEAKRTSETVLRAIGNRAAKIYARLNRRVLGLVVIKRTKLGNDFQASDQI